MKRHRNSDMSAEVVSELDAIDATLAGAPVPAQHARLADLARELRASRRAPGQDFVATLDAKVAQGFAGAVAPTGGRRASTRPGVPTTTWAPCCRLVVCPRKGTPPASVTTFMLSSARANRRWIRSISCLGVLTPDFDFFLNAWSTYTASSNFAT